mmetsp:Transcript_78062/g.135376  ORF Transcript_78062/g.135376 Transcript_78062/m.135376 type:complete len:238 (-) Transcript_78062:70-783(-)
MDFLGAGDSSSPRIDDSGGFDDEPWVNEQVEQLFTRWKNEKYAPEILPFDSRLVEDMVEALEFVREQLEDEKAENEIDPNDPDYCLREKEYERMKYIISDYLRIRLWKIQHWPQHYLEPQHNDFLSDAERTFLQEYWDSKKGFLDVRLLKGLPEAKRNLDDIVDGYLDMVRRPNLEKHIYVRITGDLPPLAVPATSSSQGSGPTTITFQNGNTYLVRYSVIREFLVGPEHDGKVQLV